MKQRGANLRRAFTMIEVITVVVIIALTVPPAVMFLDASSRRREDSVQAQRAATLAQGLMELMLADVASGAPTLGFAALSDMTTYRTSFGPRAAMLTNHYEDLGFSYALEAGPLVSSTGTATGDVQRDIFRVISVVVTAPRASGAPINIRFSALVGDM
jgi:prepilin-type N-terminal cleavage/methylation domain-containing protein